MPKTKSKGVRSLSRGLDIMEALADLGWVRVSALAAYTGIDRATVYRLAHTLIQRGYLMRRSEDGAVALASRVINLGDGVRNDDIVAHSIAPFMRKLTEKVLWPSDFGSMIVGRMTIQVSTHKFSPMSIHRHLIGKTRPLLHSALGRAYLSALTPEELANTLSVVRRVNGPDAADLRRLDRIDHVLQEVHRNGYAASVGLVEENISAIALPVRLGRRVVGAMNIVFFRSAMTPAEAAQSCLAPLRTAVQGAESALTAHLTT